MTIVLPFDPPAGDAFADNDGGNGVNAPPLGAPEGNATSTVNDIQRRDKTAIKQNVENIDAINAALGDMAEQDSTAVSITGGTIGAGVGVAEAANAAQVGGLTLQALYDLEYPIGEGMKITLSNTPPTPWTGVTATWTRVGDNKFPKLSDGVLSPGDEFSGETETGSTVLTEADLPSHEHKIFTNDNTAADTPPGASSSVARQLNGSGDRDYLMSVGTSSPASLGVTSSVGSGAGHTHTYQNNPPFYRVVLYLRTA